MFSLLIFSLMALKLLGKRCEGGVGCCGCGPVVGGASAERCVCLDRGLRTSGGAPYFSSFVDIVFDLYVLVTTANSPDVM